MLKKQQGVSGVLFVGCRFAKAQLEQLKNPLLSFTGSVVKETGLWTAKGKM